MKEKFRKYWRWVLATTVFVVLVLFFGELTLVELVSTKRTVRRLHREIERYEEQIREDSTYIEMLKDDEMLEKYAREKHLMHGADEQLFIVE